jgi:hypothetical protein
LSKVRNTNTRRAIKTATSRFMIYFKPVLKTNPLQIHWNLTPSFSCNMDKARAASAFFKDLRRNHRDTQFQLDSSEVLLRMLKITWHSLR